MVAKILWNDHLLLFFIRTKFCSLWSLRLAYDWHLELIAIITRVHVVFVLALERSDHLELRTYIITILNFKMIRAYGWPYCRFLFMTSWGLHEVWVSLFIYSGAHSLSLTILMTLHHKMWCHKVIAALIMWSGSSSNKSGNSIILSVTRVDVFLIVGWNCLELELVVSMPAHATPWIKTASSMLSWWLSYKASSSSKIFLSVIFKPLSWDLGKWWSPRIR